jgi:hypothetical protein
MQLLRLRFKHPSDKPLSPLTFQHPISSQHVLSPSSKPCQSTLVTGHYNLNLYDLQSLDIPDFLYVPILDGDFHIIGKCRRWDPFRRCPWSRLFEQAINLL